MSEDFSDDVYHLVKRLLKVENLKARYFCDRGWRGKVGNYFLLNFNFSLKYNLPEAKTFSRKYKKSEREALCK